MKRGRKSGQRPHVMYMHFMKIGDAVQLLNVQGMSHDGIYSVGVARPADQVNRVRTALVSHGIEVTALHQHLVGGDPALYFMHVWAAASPPRVLSGLRAALDIVRSAS